MSAEEDRMPVDVEQAEMWTLSDDRESVRLSLPPLPLEGLPEPLRITLDFNADTVDEILLRLTSLRAQMQPPPSPRN